MINLMLDTCVLLDLARDFRQKTIADLLEELHDARVFEVVLPQLVVEEFEKNKERVISDASKILKQTVKNARDVILQADMSEDWTKLVGLIDDFSHHTNKFDHGTSSALETVERIISKARKLARSDEITVRAAERALSRKAPFHKSKNNIADAVIIETYSSLRSHAASTQKSVFVTHNKRDFSCEDGDEREPHADFHSLFDGDNSRYYISLSEALKEYVPHELSEHLWLFEDFEKSRFRSELLEAETFLFKQVWYNRHWNMRMAIEDNRVRIVDDDQANSRTLEDKGETISRSVWDSALEAARRTEEELGLENLGPWSDFEWGLINGKLSAIRWMLGEEWDFLDT